MKKRLLSAILSLVMLLGLMSAASITTSAGNSGIKNNGLDGININIYASPYTDFAKIKDWGQYAYTDVGCAWFASARVKQLTGKGNMIYSGSTWYNTQYSNFGFSRGQDVRAKALACYTNHVQVVEKVNGNTVTISEGGSGYSDAAHDYCIIRQTTVSAIKAGAGAGGSFIGFVYLPGTIPPNVTGPKVSNVTNNTARFDFTINNPSQVSVPECGAQIRLPGGSWTTHTESIVSNHRTLASIPAWYTVGSGQEFNYTLQPGTTYEMRGYCKYNGTTYYSSVVSFTTISDKKPISSCTITISPTSYTYDGSAKTPSVTVKDGSTTLTNGTHYTVAYSNNTNAGTGTVTITGKGNYTGTASRTFIINQKDISACSITVSPRTFIYDGTAKTPTVTIKDGNTVLKNGTDYTVTYTGNVNPGTGVANINAKGNYKNSVGVAFSIVEMNVSLDKTSLTLLTNQSQQLNLSGVPSGATVAWTSSNPSVATVDSNGKVTAKTYGKAIISATVTAGSQTQTKTCNVQTRFYDVPDESVSGYDKIYWAADNGITKGYNGGEYFAPTKECTRQEFAIFLWRAMGQPDPQGINLPFSDVANLNNTAMQAISWAVKNGIIQGFADGTFRPNDNVTREQIVIMLWRAAGQPSATKALTFTDTQNYSQTSTSYKAMSWASEKGIIFGFSDNTFRPKENSKRNQIVIMLYRYVNL